jgi:hypothetical protein
MTIIAFPAHRIVRTVSAEMQRGQRITPLALMLMPARFWVNCMSAWMDIMLANEPETDVTFHLGGMPKTDRR